MSKNVKRLLAIKKQIEETEIDLKALTYVSREILFSLSVDEQKQFLIQDLKIRQDGLNLEIKSNESRDDIPIYNKDEILIYFESRLRKFKEIPKNKN